MTVSLEQFVQYLTASGLMSAAEVTSFQDTLPPDRKSKDGETLAFVRQDKPEKPDLVRCWSQAQPARKLTNLKDIPILIISSEASYHASYDHCTAAYLTQAGVANTFIHLADRGIHGNGHMMMLEKNSDAIAGVIEGWLKTAVPAKPASRPVQR